MTALKALLQPPCLQQRTLHLLQCPVPGLLRSHLWALLHVDAIGAGADRQPCELPSWVMLVGSPSEGASGLGGEGGPMPSAEFDTLLAQFQDVFPAELPAGLPPDRGVGHTIPLEAGARPTFALSTG